jgi:hypothetical protein
MAEKYVGLVRRACVARVVVVSLGEGVATATLPTCAWSSEKPDPCDLILIRASA